MRVLSVIIASPLRKISGATNAGRDLSIATAHLVDLDLAIMWDEDETHAVGPLKIRHMKCTNRLGPLTGLAPRFVRVPLYDSAIPELIDPKRYDLVHIHNLVPMFAAERVARACQRAGIPYVISTHGFVEFNDYARINGFGPVKSALADIAITRPFHRLVRGAHTLFALSDCELPLLASLGVPPEKVRVVTNGVNEYFMQPPEADTLERVRANFLDGAGPVLLFMGSLHAYKGVDVFLQSLAETTGPFRAIVAGGLKDDAQKQALLDKAGLAPDVAARVRFTGSISNPDLRALYHLADLFVYPTRGDTLPLVVLEAMACGRGVVSTRVGGIPFSVKPETGVLVEPGDPHAVAAAVNALCADPARRAAMGEAGRARVKQIFQWSAAAQAAAENYRDILGVPHAPLESRALGANARA